MINFVQAVWAVPREISALENQSLHTIQGNKRQLQIHFKEHSPYPRCLPVFLCSELDIQEGPGSLGRIHSFLSCCYSGLNLMYMEFRCIWMYMEFSWIFCLFIPDLHRVFQFLSTWRKKEYGKTTLLGPTVLFCSFFFLMLLFIDTRPITLL